MAHLVLTGFMGTGKSTAGQIVAATLGRSFIDMDTEIERRTGCSIPDLFATQGEAAFRRMERDLCQELAGRDGLVIATGGGALLPEDNRRLMMQHGVVICLTASVEALLARLKGDTGRPLLRGNDPAARLTALMTARADAYRALPHHIDTTHLDPSQTAEAVLSLWHRYST